MSLTSVNPATGEIIKEYKEWTNGEVSGVVQKVHDVWDDWRATSFSQRGRLMSALAARLKSAKEDLARMITMEMGKSISEARAEIDKCALGV